MIDQHFERLNDRMDWYAQSKFESIKELIYELNQQHNVDGDEEYWCQEIDEMLVNNEYFK